MIGNLLKKMFGTQNERVLERIAPLVRRINELEAQVQALPD
ncbi:MAG: Preprotein translocase subunit SecA, partial [Actinobacteria bacterium]|nr:Preprotein translocase subunit SecA [Actinomycetota bacterium]